MSIQGFSARIIQFGCVHEEKLHKQQHDLILDNIHLIDHNSPTAHQNQTKPIHLETTHKRIQLLCFRHL